MSTSTVQSPFSTPAQVQEQACILLAMARPIMAEALYRPGPATEPSAARSAGAWEDYLHACAANKVVPRIGKGLEVKFQKRRSGPYDRL